MNENTTKPSVIYIKLDDSQAGMKAIEKCADKYARENGAVNGARIKVRPGNCLHQRYKDYNSLSH